jgi:uncharacterized protein (DUF2164 family)
MRVKLSEERRRDLVQSFQSYCRAEFDEDVSELKAERVLDYFVERLGPPVYNQAIRDAHAFLQEKLQDLEGEFYEPETDHGSKP